MIKKYYKNFDRDKFPSSCVLKAELEDKFCETVININWYEILYNRISFISLATQKFTNCKYLEIGADHNHCFNSIPVKDKTGVDPKQGGNTRTTSDNFFKKNNKFFDVIFVDGLHTFEQCRKDIINSLKFLNVNGYLFIHDLIPRNFMEEFVPPMGTPWSGDVWKVAQELCKTKGLKFYVIKADHGVGLIKKIQDNINYFDDYNNLKNLKFKDFLEINKEINYIEPEEAIEIIKK